MNVAQPIEWTSKGVVMLDQRRLPGEVIRHTYTDYRDVAAAIKDMVIRGAPAIGVADAMGALRETEQRAAAAATISSATCTFAPTAAFAATAARRWCSR